jgi:hypothetical protein
MIHRDFPGGIRRGHRMMLESPPLARGAGGAEEDKTVTSGVVRKFVLVAFILTATAGLAAGQDDPADATPRRVVPRWSIAVFGFWPDVDTKIRVDSADGTIGSELDLEDDLGLSDRETLPAADVVFRINRRHRLEAGYFQLRRSGDTILDATIRIGDEVFEASDEIFSAFDADVLRLAYAYSFINDGRTEFGLIGGFHVMDFFVGIRTVDTEVTGEGELTAPLPTIGVQGGVPLGGKWSFRGRLQIFRLEIDDYSGVLDHADAHVNYQAFRKVSFGMGWYYYLIDVDSEDEDWRGRIAYEFSGPMVSVLARF